MDGAGLLSLSRNIGASLGRSVVSFLLARNIQISHAALAGHITALNLPTDPNTALRFGQSGDSAMAMLDGEINRQAAMIAYLNDFHFMLWVTLAILPLVLLLRQPTHKKDNALQLWIGRAHV